jgi:hypothetical protein
VVCACDAEFFVLGVHHSLLKLANLEVALLEYRKRIDMMRYEVCKMPQYNFGA